MKSWMAVAVPSYSVSLVFTTLHAWMHFLFLSEDTPSALLSVPFFSKRAPPMMLWAILASLLLLPWWCLTWCLLEFVGWSAPVLTTVSFVPSQRTLSESIRSLTQQRDFVKVTKADLSQQPTSACTSLSIFKQTAKARRDADIFELHAMRCKAGGMSVDSDFTAAANRDVWNIAGAT